MEFLIGTALLGGLLVAGILLLAAVVLKTVFWAVTLPVRLLLRLLFFPFRIARTALRLVWLVILAPILAVGGVLVAGVVIIAGLLAVLAPLLPIVVITFLVWLVVRGVSHRAVQVS
jgi:hypothetical protein